MLLTSVRACTKVNIVNLHWSCMAFHLISEAEGLIHNRFLIAGGCHEAQATLKAFRAMGCSSQSERSQGAKIREKPSKTKPSKSTIPDARGPKCRNKPSNLSSCMLSASISGHKDPNPLGAAQFPVSIFLDNSHQIHKVTSLTCQLLLTQVRTVDLSMLDRRYGP